MSGMPDNFTTNEKSNSTKGTPEESSLTVKLLGDDWIVENPVGKSVGSAPNREAAVELARKAAADENASAISVLAADGSVEYTVAVYSKSGEI
jgi:hypothetical protein